MDDNDCSKRPAHDSGSGDPAKNILPETKANDNVNDGGKSASPDGTNGAEMISQLTAQNITLEDLQTAVRVLNAVASLAPKKQKHNNKKKRSRDDEDGSKTETNDNNAADDANAGDEGQALKQPQDELDAYKNSRILRPFRKALASCIDVHQRTMFNGKTKEQFLQDRIEERTLKRQKMAERDMQRKHIANTALRRGRIERLQQKKDQEGQEEEAMKLKSMMAMMIPDGHVETMSFSAPKLLTSSSGEQDKLDNNTDQTNSAKESEEPVHLPKLRSCYVCKVRFRELHHFYDQLCPPCAALNWEKRHQSRDLTGKVAVVTGSRVKIGYQTCLKLLRAGATVVATTRFPNAAADTYRRETDFDQWKDRLQIFGLDLRDVTGIEAFCRYLKIKLADTGLDILINNACQTIRRPRAYYLPACEKEQELWKQADETHQQLLSACRQFETIRRRMFLEHKQEDQGFVSSTDKSESVTLLHAPEESNIVSTVSQGSAAAMSTPFENTGMTHSAAASQMILLPEDVGVPESVLPKGATDINGQQLDLRSTNSWLLKLDEVSTPEVMECMFINAIAPFVLNSRLKPLMCIPKAHDDRYVVNVSAMEGKFYRYKMANHPHTNMAKSALNMMTRTSAEDLAKNHNIYMNSIDTGWINDENPLERASKTAQTNLFQTPIDEIDAAARIVDPIFSKSKDYGKFLKDYRETEW